MTTSTPKPAHVAPPSSDSLWQPLRFGSFRVVWFGVLVVNLATMMQSAGAAWLMVSLTSSPLLVGMIQTASMLPSVLFSVPGGVLADLVDRRRLLLAVQVWMLTSTLAAVVLTYLGLFDPWSLLLVTAALGLGFALQMPAWYTSLTESVPRRHVSAAASLSSIAFNAARATGPAIAGAVVVVSGVAAVFALCAIAFAGAIVSLAGWKGSQRPNALPPESLFSGLRDALRYTRHSTDMRLQLLRTGLFVSAASGLWALLPLVARDQLRLGAGGYGILLGTLGAGAIIGALLMPALRRILSFTGAADLGAIAYATALAITSQIEQPVVVVGALLGAGIAWIVVGNTQIIAIQTSVPAWVRARALSVYMLAFQGSMALGGIIWGGVASYAGTPRTLLVSALAMLGVLAVMRRHPASLGEESDVTPAIAADVPVLERDPEAQEGPVAVQIDYCIRPETRDAFVRAMHAVGVARRRDGASVWRLYRNLADSSRYVERFIVDSWVDYLRHRARATVADRLAEERAAALHVGERPPEMQHFIAEPLTREAP